MRKTTRTQYALRALLLTALLMLGASWTAPAQGVTIDVNADHDGNLLDAYEAANAGDTLVLGRPDAEENGEEEDEDARTTEYNLTDTLIIDKSLTIRGDSALLPSAIVVRHAGVVAGPVLEVADGIALTLENLTLTGGTSGLLAGVDSEITINRAYLRANSESGVELNNVSSATITNSAIVNNNQYGVRIVGDIDADTNQVQIGQSSFIGNGSTVEDFEDRSDDCLDMLALLDAWENFLDDPEYGDGADNLESDTVPVSFLLALMAEVVCEAINSELLSALEAAMDENIAALRAEDFVINQDEVDEDEDVDPITVGDALRPYENALAAALAIGLDLQADLIALLDANGLPLDEDYVVIDCVFLEPNPDDPEADTGWDCEDGGEEPFSGAGDLDRDGLSNAEEYDNIIANGGDETDFALAAVDPGKVGTEFFALDDFVGMDIADAEALIADLPIGAYSVGYRVDPAPAGEVIAQDPEANAMVLEGARLRLIVSLGELDTAAVSVTSGMTSIYASLFHENYRGIENTGDEPVASWGNIFDANRSSDTVGEVDFPIEAPEGQSVELGSGWIGKLRSDDPLESGLEPDDYPDALGTYNLDFERDRRGEHREVLVQVGADEVGDHLYLGLGWLNTTIFPDPAFTGDEVSILIELGTMGLTADNVEILIRPQTLSTTTALNDTDLMVRVDNANLIDAYTLQGFLTIRDGLVPGDAEYVLDGEAQVYLLSSENQIYGVGTPNEQYVAPSAADNSFFTIDNTPPVLLGGIRANQFVINSNDDIGAPVPIQPYPSNWAPAGETTPASGVQLADVGDSQGEPQIFFNIPLDIEPGTLNYDVVMTFEDRPPAGFEGVIQPGGFANVELSTDAFLQVAFRGGAAVLALSGSEELEPTPADKVQVGDMAVDVSDAGYPTLNLSWEFRDLDYVRDEESDPIVYFYNDWRLTGQFRVLDGFGTVRERSNRFHMWWMHEAVATITSSKFNGRQTTDPTFNWGLQRGNRTPENAFPAYPIAQFQIFVQDAGGAWQAATSVPSPWIADRTIDRFTVVNADTGQRLGDLIQDNPQGVFAIAIIGADEAGNVQEQNWNAVLLDGRGWDSWTNEPQAAAIDTHIQGRFWYFDLDDILPNRPLGPATRIMMPGCDQVMRINGEFLLQANAAGRRIEGIAWRLLRNGEEIVVSDDDTVISGAQGTLLLSDIFDLVDLDQYLLDLCQPEDAEAGIERTQEFVLEAAGVLSNGDMDPNPASYRFFVVADLPLLDDQPIKETVRE